MAGFQSYVAMGGFSLARNFALQPYRVTEPLGRTSFLLKSDSKVEVLVNGRPAQTLQLVAGPHTLRDFMFTSGANDVTLRITDDVGRTETIHLSFFFDTRLLAQGEQEFAYSVGEPSHLEDDGFHYADDFPTYSMFHRIGLTDRLTVGANFQGDGDRQMLGGEAVLATSLGTFAAVVAGSHSADYGSAGAALVQYRYYDAGLKNPYGRTYSLGTEYRGRDFGALGESLPRGSATVALTAQYSQQLPWQMACGVGGSYQLNLDGPRDTTGLNASLRKRFGPNLTAEVTFDRNDTLAGDTEYRAFISLNLLLPGPRQSLNTSYDTLARVGRLDWQYTPERNVGGLAANAGVQGTPDDYAFFGGATYTDYRAEISLGEDVTTPTDSEMSTDVRTRFRFGTALVFAGGVFGISRPINDSYAIVTPHPSLAGQRIGTEPIRDTYSARTSFLGPAVVADLQSYQVRRIVTEASHLPPGYDFGPDIFTLRPTYRSGTVVRVGREAHRSIRGILQDAAGEPVRLQAGELALPTDPSGEPVLLFTNREGGFYAEGLRAGAYVLRLFADPQAVVAVEIPAGPVGVQDLGVLRLPAGVRLR